MFYCLIIQYFIRIHVERNWNIKGDLFFTLHPKFEELYNSLYIKD